jgi:hypothetical protein
MLFLTAAFAFWGIWSLAYQRGQYRGFNEGYSKGTRDEYACWKQEPAPAEEVIRTGRRDSRLGLGGKPPASPIIETRGGLVKVNHAEGTISSKVSP